MTDTTSGRPDHFAELREAVEELARARYLLDQVVELADNAPRLTDAELRCGLALLADRARVIKAGSSSAAG